MTLQHVVAGTLTADNLVTAAPAEAGLALPVPLVGMAADDVAPGTLPGAPA